MDASPSSDLRLWYRQPADSGRWEQGLPLGNGRLGAMVFGGIEREHILLNEDSIWSGWPEPANDRAGSFRALERVRELIRTEAAASTIKQVAMDEFCSLHGYGKKDFGAFQAFCDLWVDTGHDPAMAVDYRRALDLATGMATVRYRIGEVTYTRELFCSYPAQVAVWHMTADQAGAINTSFSVTSLHSPIHVSIEDQDLVLAGQVQNGDTGHPGMAFEGRCRVRLQGGHIQRDGNTLQVTGADAVTLLMAGSSNYQLAYPAYRGEAPTPRNQRVLDRLADQDLGRLRQAHITDYQQLFNRVNLHLDGPSNRDKPTDQRLAYYKKAPHDRGLESLMFQYGRYLLIASSRPGGLPANLQGLWNNSNKPPWNGDYHLNINLQMNYWPADLCNLAECFEPLLAWTEDLRLAGTKTARTHYQARGWVAHHTCNVWGFTSPGPNRGIHMLEAESAAFLCQNLWDHYAFSGDHAVLERIWPLLKDAALFWVDNLQEVENGWLAVSPSYSPEHGPLSDSACYQTMIVWDLFTHCIEAARLLDTDPELSRQLAQLRERLPPPLVGTYGQLQEWRDPALEMRANKDRHRHLSHLYAVYPGHQIVPGRDPELTQAAIQSMRYRGDSATGWSMGWKVNLWARLRDGDHAHTLIQHFLGARVYPNLWCAHPPFQIDGNFGYTAGIAEMLVQSQTGEIVLLPALPADWPSGSIRGLRARGGIEVDLSWHEGELVEARVQADHSASIVLRYRKYTRAKTLEAGESCLLNVSDFLAHPGTDD